MKTTAPWPLALRLFAGTCVAPLALGSLLTAAALAAPAAAPAAGAHELKIGTIDLKKVFDAYYKTQLADASIKDEASGLEKDLKAYTADHDKAVTEYKKAVEEGSNQALSAEEREKRKKDAEGKLIKVNDLRQTIEQFNRTARNNLDEKLRLTRDKIVAEIKNVVNTRAKAMGFTMVLDTSSADAGGRPSVVLYHTGENDMTSAVIQQLNANAPPDLPLTDKNGKKEEPEKKDEKKNDKENKK